MCLETRSAHPFSGVRSPPEFAATLSAEWMPLCAANKDGKGDGSGAIPEDAMAIVGELDVSTE